MFTGEGVRRLTNDTPHRVEAPDLHISGGVEGHAKGDQHPYRHSSQPDTSVAGTAQALIKIAHPLIAGIKPGPLM